jgi:predicted nucleic acid-binding protein
MEKYREVPADWQWRIAATTLGELQASHLMSTSSNQSRRDEYSAFVVEEYSHNVIQIGASTAFYFAEVIGRIWHKHPPPSDKTRTDRHLLDCGVDINDVWLVATAFEHGLIVLTTDKMPCIREILTEQEVRFECWLATPNP